MTVFVTIDPAGLFGKTQESAENRHVRPERGERRNAFTARNLVIAVVVVRNAEVGSSSLLPSTTASRTEGPGYCRAFRVYDPPRGCTANRKRQRTDTR